MPEPSWYDIPLSELRTYGEWPRTPEVFIIPGGAGHEQEVTATFGFNYDWDNPIPELLESVVAQLLPATWKIDNRGTRLEFHPSGRHYGGFHEDDVEAIAEAMRELGFEPEVRRFDFGDTSGVGWPD